MLPFLSRKRQTCLSVTCMMPLSVLCLMVLSLYSAHSVLNMVRPCKRKRSHASEHTSFIFTGLDFVNFRIPMRYSFHHFIPSVMDPFTWLVMFVHYPMPNLLQILALWHRIFSFLIIFNKIQWLATFNLFFFSQYRNIVMKVTPFTYHWISWCFLLLGFGLCFWIICYELNVEQREKWESIAIMSQWMMWPCLIYRFFNPKRYLIQMTHTKLTSINCEPFNWANDKFVEFCKIILSK